MRDPAFLEVADRIGRRLCRDAIWAGRQCNWTGWSIDAFRNGWLPVYKALPSTLYEGTAGVALFLAHLWAATRDQVIRRTLEGAVNRTLAGLEAVAPELQTSFYYGAAGIAYCCIETGEAAEADGLVRKGVDLLRQIAGRDPEERFTDICNGAAGTIQAMLRAASHDEAELLVPAAERLGDLLLRTAHRSDEGWSWDTAQTAGQRHLLGYANGSAGIGCALAELSAATGESRFGQAALEAFRYERAHFDARNLNWPDFRQNPAASSGEAQIISAWCYGAPGIGLARLRGYDVLRDVETLGDLNIALDATVRSVSAPLTPGAGSFCLCHGYAGNADLFIETASILDRADLHATAETVGRNGMAQFHAPDLPWPCGVGSGETPNLMLGLAGIGYFYLRLFDPSAVHSVLLVRQSARKSAVLAQAS
jgi:lantibiotic modifying enzyme